MPLDPHAKRLLDMLAAISEPRSDRPPLEDRRQAFRQLMRLGARREPIGKSLDLSAPGPGGPIPLRQYTPVTTQEGPLAALVYFHGGGLFAGDLDTHDGLCRALANASGCSIIAVAYRLAPENKFPAAINDGCAAVAWVMANASLLRISAARIGIAGDSAGANIAAVVCQILRHAPGPALWMQLLLCPILHWRVDNESRRTLASGYLIETRDIALELSEYQPDDGDLHDSRLSPLMAPDLRGLPVTFIHAAEFDPLRDEALAYADRLRCAKVDVHDTCHPGMIHMFYALPAIIPYADVALSMIAAQIASTLEREPA